MSNGNDGPQHGDDAAPTPTFVDLALRLGSDSELRELRARLGSDPTAAIEFAEAVQFLERLRGVAVEPRAGFAADLDLLARAQGQRMARRRREPTPVAATVGLLAAAAAVFALLAITDPLGLRAGFRELKLAADGDGPVAVVRVADQATPEPMTPQLAQVFEAGERLTRGTRLESVWSRFRSAGPDERMAQWLSPRNAVAVLRLEQELRSTAELRRRALAARGHLPEVETRVQLLARDLADDLLAGGGGDVDEVAVTLRALVAAGGSQVAAIERGEQRLLAILPQLEGGPLARALLALGELGAATGHCDAAVTEHGRRLVRDVLAADGDNWQRRWPRLLARTTPAVEIAEAGRFLRIAPAFGIDADEAALVRLLLAAELQERREPRNETPWVPVALVYGFADLLAPGEREELEARLRTWRPTTLVPEYLTLQQLAATRAPCHTGYARFQLDLRRVGAIATPQRWLDRAALCLCLSTSFAPDQDLPPIFG